jgi:release factor glutamine methyltransferase
MILKHITKNSLKNTSIKILLSSTIAKLRSAKISNAEQEAFSIVSFICKKPTSWLVAHEECKTTSVQLQALNKIITQRLTGIPLAYITGQEQFCGLEFYVNKHTLIPRPETELLVREAIELLKSPVSRTKKLINIIDVGTGSGAVAIALAQHCRQSKLPCRIIASDISPRALAVAERNIQKHKVANIITLRKDNLLKNTSIKADIITANLPYIATDKIDQLADPKLALDGGPKGHELIEKLLIQIKDQKILRSGGSIILEIGHGQGHIIRQLARQNFPQASIRVHRDLANWDRIIIINTL